MEFVLVGYFPKLFTPRPEWLDAPQVKEICSVSQCIASGPNGWLERWTHNELWLYNSIVDAWAVALPEAEESAWRVYAYCLLPLEFTRGEQRRITLPPLQVDPIPADFVSLGFDVVSRSQGTMYECSPLSCNHLANEVSANEYCLVSSTEEAVKVADEFATEEPEPGPYVVFEIHRSKTASAD